MAAETQAQRLRALEQVNSMGTAARTSVLAADPVSDETAGGLNLGKFGQLSGFCLTGGPADPVDLLWPTCVVVAPADRQHGN